MTKEHEGSGSQFWPFSQRCYELLWYVREIDKNPCGSMRDCKLLCCCISLPQTSNIRNINIKRFTFCACLSQCPNKHWNLALNVLSAICTVSNLNFKPLTNRKALKEPWISDQSTLQSIKSTLRLAPNKTRTLDKPEWTLNQLEINLKQPQVNPKVCRPAMKFWASVRPWRGYVLIWSNIYYALILDNSSTCLHLNMFPEFAKSSWYFPRICFDMVCM